LPPAVVLVALLVGGTLAGILGALLALPIAAGLQMVIRELHVDLPGETPATSETHKIEERANQVYERLAEGVTAADAGIIADDLASIVKKTEEGRTTMSAELPVIGDPTPDPAPSSPGA
jgi:chromate transport protein ChrA